MNKVLVFVAVVIVVFSAGLLGQKTYSRAERLVATQNGDVNCDGKIDMRDPMHLLVWLFTQGPGPCDAGDGTRTGATLATLNGDVNCDGDINVSDSTHLLGWLLTQGPPPCHFADTLSPIENRPYAVEEQAYEARSVENDDNPTAAANLEAKVGCSRLEPEKPLARLEWDVAAIPGREQRVEVTIFREGFESGRFETSESLPPDQSSLAWERLRGQAVHSWRVVTLQAEGWVPSETARFRGPLCRLPSRFR